LPARSPYRRRGRAAVSELYSGVVLLAVTLAVASLVYSGIRPDASPEPIFTESSFTIPGNPPIDLVNVSSSSAASPVALAIGGASSQEGVLAATPTGYAATAGLCQAGAVTFFSAKTDGGTLSVSTDGAAWIDGIPGPARTVLPGWHEIMIEASSCSVALPGGGTLGTGTAGFSSVPRVQTGNLSFEFYVPCFRDGQGVTIVFDGGILQLEV
jgi:hypothetical protein